MQLPAATPQPVDPAQFLRIAAQGSGIASHEDLWRWLGGEVQVLLPHELLLVAWGDFRSGALQFDLVSSRPGLRTRESGRLRLAALAGLLRDCWVAAQHQPCRVDLRDWVATQTTRAERSEAAPPLAGLGHALVHGMREAAGASERIVAALGPPPAQEGAPEAEGLALRLLLPFIDAALRRMPLPAPPAPSAPLAPPGGLSEREQQVMGWVALGKTNPEIGCILRISEFTVKNHLKSIFSKLDVSNRAQAVAKLTRLATPA